MKLFAEVRSGNVAAVRTALRSLQLMPSARDEFGNTVLIIAVERNDKAMIKLALKYGVDVNWVNFAGNSALHVAAADGNHFRLCVKCFRSIWVLTLVCVA